MYNITICIFRFIITNKTKYKLKENFFINFSREFVTEFLVPKLHISHVTQSDNMNYHLLLPWAFTNPVSSSYDIWKLRFQGGVYTAPFK